MKLLVERLDVWAATLQDKPGALAELLDALRHQGANLQSIIAQRRRSQNSRRCGNLSHYPTAAGRSECAPRGFEVEWQVVELSPEARKIEFALRYEFDHALVGKLAEGVFDGIADTLVDAFARRAEHVLDRTGPSNGRDPHPTPGRMP